MTTHLKSEVETLRKQLAEAHAELEAWRSYDRNDDGDATRVVDDVVKVWSLRKAYPTLRTNVAPRMAIALYESHTPLSVERLDELVPMSWARNGGERRDLRAYFSVLACHLRNALGRDAVETVNGYGYQLSPGGRELLTALWASRD